jgi:hypothetical protein
MRMNRKERRRLASHAEGGLVAYGLIKSISGEARFLR